MQHYFVLLLASLSIINTFGQQYGTCKATNGRHGECISTKTCATYGGQSDPANLCPGDNTIQCCTYGTCVNTQGIPGICQPTSTCTGRTDPANLCKGGALIQCCTTSTTNTADSFTRRMNIILPPMNGVAPHITSAYGWRLDVFHGGVDFNYNVPGQEGINQEFPVVYSPVDGVVSSIASNYGTVKVRAADGYSHEILHLNSISVRLNDNVRSGSPIGRMGGTGPNGPNQYDRHVHYQIKTSSGVVVNPQTFF